MVNIRLLQAADAADFRQLRLLSFQESPLGFSESHEDESKRPLSDFEEEITPIGTPPTYYVLGAFLQDQLVGFVKFKRDRRSKALHKSMVHAMYTKAELRSQGIGKRLMEEVIRRAQAMPGLEQIHLWVLHTDRSASGFYKRLGFIPQGPMVKKDLKVGDQYIDAEYLVLYFK
ncbi:MAG: GNAT family N-acetyltransferase [Saprospiraceae bacterium]|nr:GNAT family N-acetyltransferase [Saprospiraceae bacterium]